MQGFAAVTTAVVVNSPRESWLRSGAVATMVWNLSERMPWLPGVSLPVRVGVLAAEVAIVALLFAAVAQRFLLRFLLSDKSFLYNSRSPTLYNKLWFLLVRCLTRRRPLTYTFQSSLPSLPVPELKETVAKYVESARQIQTPEQFAETQKLAASFIASEGPRLQWFLKLKSWISPNYVTDWWEKYVYLRGRSSIAINSNYYVLDSGREHATTVREARAAVLIYTMMKYKEQLASERIEPVMVSDSVPLCMWQFERMFGTSRIPGRECDEIKHWDASYTKHVVVNVGGSMYKLNVYRRDGSLRTPDELEDILTAMTADAATRRPSEAEASIPALTAENRTRWAEVRESYFCDGLVNRRSLHTVESALLYIALSEASFDEADWTARGKYLLCGNRERPDIWFDKSVNVVVFKDGKSGLNCEHAWADAPVAAHLFEISMIVGEWEMSPYDPENGERCCIVLSPSCWTCASAGTSICCCCYCLPALASQW